MTKGAFWLSERRGPLTRAKRSCSIQSREEGGHQFLLKQVSEEIEEAIWGKLLFSWIGVWRKERTGGQVFQRSVQCFCKINKHISRINKRNVYLESSYVNQCVLNSQTFSAMFLSPAFYFFKV